MALFYWMVDRAPLPPPLPPPPPKKIRNKMKYLRWVFLFLLRLQLATLSLAFAFQFLFSHLWSLADWMGCPQPSTALEPLSTHLCYSSSISSVLCSFCGWCLMDFFIHCFLFFPEADKKKPSGKHAIKVFRFHFLPLSLSFQKFPPFPAHPRIGWFSPSFSPPATKIHIFTHSTARFPSLLHGVASTSTPRSLLNSLWTAGDVLPVTEIKRTVRICIACAGSVGAKGVKPRRSTSWPRKRQDRGSNKHGDAWSRSGNPSPS